MLEDNGETQDLDKAKKEAAAENDAATSTPAAPATLAEPMNETQEAPTDIGANDTTESSFEDPEKDTAEEIPEEVPEETADTTDNAAAENSALVEEVAVETAAEPVTEATSTEEDAPEEFAVEEGSENTEQAEPSENAAAAVAEVADDAAVQETPNEAGTESESIDEPAAQTYEPVRFQELALPDPLVAAVDELGFEFCTPIQGRSLPFSLSDYDVTGQAQTGTGKTAAFLITLFTRFWENPLQTEQRTGTPRALVLAPTRELAMQIEGDAQSLSKHMGMRTVCVVGGMDYGKQREELEEGPVDVLVATPGRLIDFVERREINLREVEVLVIDEADRMLDMGFIPDVRRIVLQTPHKRKRQTLFFSATFNDAVMRLAQSWTIDAEHIIVEPESVATDTVDQKFWLVGARERQKVLFQFLSHAQPERAIIFANRRDQTHRIVEFLRKKDIPCEALAGDVPQRKRMATLARFKEGKLRYLIATDVAGRGIHVDGVTHVINYELPDDSEDYVHRIGRTGRAGASGTSISFVSEDDAFNLPALEEYLGTRIKCIQPDLLPDS